MKLKHKRIIEKKETSDFIVKLHKYAYIETIAILSLFLLIGYFIDNNDICMFSSNIPYLLIILTIVTLFHGFESGIIAIGIVAVTIWFFYPSFLYVEFLVLLMLTLLFSEFHYYWTTSIKQAQTDSDYRGMKLGELSKAFYTLKISHDQLEKNYVVKPMSLRNSIQSIKEAFSNDEEYYDAFLQLLDKTFHVSHANIVYRTNPEEEFQTIAKPLQNANSIAFEDPLVEEVVEKAKPVYVSDEHHESSRYIAVIPALENGGVVGMLIIEKMPFMAFNKENLTSISILFEYFCNEITKVNILDYMDILGVIEDDEFRFEYNRLYDLYKLYSVNSISFVLRCKEELLAKRLNDTIARLLRSLDLVTLVKQGGTYYVVLLFPFADTAAALGFMSRLYNKMGDLSQDQFEYMTFDFSQSHLLDEYLRKDYVQ